MSFGIGTRNAIDVGLGGIIAFATNPWGGSVFDGAAAAYSTRIPAGGIYGGPLLRVRRSSDNAEQDIYASAIPDANGNRFVDTVALLSFVGAGSGFITTWYDQSGNGRTITQATTASQPRIVNAGVVDTLNGRPAVVFDGVAAWLGNNSPFMWAQGSALVNMVASAPANATAASRYFFGEGLSTSNTPIYGPLITASTISSVGGVFIRNDAGAALVQTNLSIAEFTNTPAVLTHVDSGNSITPFANGISGSTVAYTRSGTLTLNRFAFGAINRIAPAGFAQGSVTEIFISTATGVNRQALERNQGTAFGITVA